MTAFEAFQLYVALKQHFNQKTYDYVKYNGKIKTTYSQFEHRRDRYYFEKLAKHENPKGFLISNFIHNTSFWVGEINHNQESEDIYISWKRRQESFEYLFKQCISDKLYKHNIEDLIKIPENGYPLIMVMYLQKIVSPETLVVFVDSIRCYNYWNKNLKQDIVWDSVSKLILKYKPFLNYDVKKYREYIKTIVDRD